MVCIASRPVVLPALSCGLWWPPVPCIMALSGLSRPLVGVSGPFFPSPWRLFRPFWPLSALGGMFVPLGPFSWLLRPPVAFCGGPVVSSCPLVSLFAFSRALVFPGGGLYPFGLSRPLVALLRFPVACPLSGPWSLVRAWLLLVCAFGL